MTGPVTLTKAAPAVILEHRKIHSWGKIAITTNWRRSSIDLDQGVVAKTKEGQAFAVQALGNQFGSLREPPYFALNGDDTSGGTGETTTATYRKVRDKLSWFGVYLYNCTDQRPLKLVQGAVTVVKFPGMPDIVVTHDAQDGPISAILQVFNEPSGFRIQRDLRAFTPRPGQLNQECVDKFWGVGLSWTRCRK